MNKKQRVILLLGALYVSIVLIFPPWEVTENNVFWAFAGYYSVLSPPEASGFESYRVALAPVVLHALAVATVTGTLVAIFGSRKRSGEALR